MNLNQPRENKTAPHSALRVVEAKLRDFKMYISKDDPVWGAVDRLWDHVVLGDMDE